MIQFRTGDILQEDAEALVNTVNCVGIMGRGIALRFRNAFPENYKAYARACRHGEVEPGRMFVFETRQLANPRYIINFPTKRHWRGKARIEDIEIGLEALVAEIRERGIRSVAVPPLGAGLGGLDWAVVRPRVERVLLSLDDVRITLFEPYPASAPQATTTRRKVPQMTAGRAVLVGLIDRYLSGLLDPFVTLLEIHKLVYFMQQAGEPLRLRFAAGRHGPYAENLRHLLRAIEGYYISGYGEGGEEPGKAIELVPGATTDARKVLAARAETRSRFERVAELVEGFESPFGLELLSTVHWISTRNRPTSEEELIRLIYQWDARKCQFSPDQIRLAERTLCEKRWIECATG